MFAPLGNLRCLSAAFALACGVPVSAAEPDTPPAPVEAPAAAGPALWRVADEDTTIYLFGTIHALPPGTEWFNQPIATALGAADTLVTELPADAMRGTATSQFIAERALLPPGKTLRELLDPEQLASYEAALATVNLPPNYFDAFEPWFAGINLALIPLLAQGYDPSSGVELTIFARAPEGIGFEALETIETQVDMFDSMPQPMQIAFLVSTTDGVESIKPTMDALVREWLEGDADAVADQTNAGFTDREMSERLLFARNRAWAVWVAGRLAKPGTVFVAVGAGHLAGSGSVQDYLTARGIEVARLQ